MRRTARMAISLACGVLAVIIVLVYVSDVRAEADRAREQALAELGGEPVSVCVATRTIHPGELLDESNVAVEQWVAGLVPEDASDKLEDVVGKQVSSVIPERAVVCDAYLERDEEALEVPSGMVAVSVPADEARAVGGAVAPGDNVDVYVSSSGVADRLCSGRVIDSSARVDGGSNASITWVTLAIEPEHVSEVLAATAQGSISLTLPASPMRGEDAGDGDE